MGNQEPIGLIEPSIEVARRDRKEDCSQDQAAKNSTKYRLDEDCILNLSKSRLLDPGFAIEDLPDTVTLLVLGNPGLCLVAVVAVEAVEGVIFAFHLAGCFVFILKQLPRPEVSVVHAVKDDTHALPGGNESADANEVENEGDGSPAAVGAGECDENVNKQAGENATDTKTAGEDDTGTVAVADSPADEVGVSLAA